MNIHDCAAAFGSQQWGWGWYFKTFNQPDWIEFNLGVHSQSRQLRALILSLESSESRVAALAQVFKIELRVAGILVSASGVTFEAVTVAYHQVSDENHDWTVSFAAVTAVRAVRLTTTQTDFDDMVIGVLTNIQLRLDLNSGNDKLIPVRHLHMTVK
jgi:hypothetical protein